MDLLADYRLNLPAALPSERDLRVAAERARVAATRRVTEPGSETEPVRVITGGVPVAPPVTP